MDLSIGTSGDIYQLAGVSKTYRKGGRQILAVRELDLDIREGEWLAVQGKTGHGVMSRGRLSIRQDTRA